jgi:hypothetical protein
VPVDRWEHLGWMAERKDNEPGAPTMFGTTFLQQAAGLAGDDGLAWDAVARTAAHLKRLGHIDWSYIPKPNVDRSEPRLEFVDSSFLQRVQEIHVTDRATRRWPPVRRTAEALRSPSATRRWANWPSAISQTWTSS